jgi:hypothetical protein
MSFFPGVFFHWRNLEFYRKYQVMPGKTTLYSAAIIAIILAAILCGSCANTTVNRADDEKAIKAHIDQIVRAYMGRDSATVRKTHSKKWRGFLSNSTHILRGIDDYMAEAIGSGIFNKENPWRIVNYKMLDFDIVFNDNTGIVNYIAEFYWEGETEKGSYKLRSIDIYGKENGHWNQVASNIGPLPVDN